MKPAHAAHPVPHRLDATAAGHRVATALSRITGRPVATRATGAPAWMHAAEAELPSPKGT